MQCFNCRLACGWDGYDEHGCRACIRAAVPVGSARRAGSEVEREKAFSSLPQQPKPNLPRFQNSLPALEHVKRIVDTKLYLNSTVFRTPKRPTRRTGGLTARRPSDSDVAEARWQTLCASHCASQASRTPTSTQTSRRGTVRSSVTDMQSMLAEAPASASSPCSGQQGSQPEVWSNVCFIGMMHPSGKRCWS
eukprot:2195117-Rhodomonas_salina.4